MLPQAARIFIMLLLGLAVWNPKLAWKNAPADVFLLLDESNSLSAKMKAAAWQKVQGELLKLPDSTRLYLIRFAGDAATELGPLELARTGALLDAPNPPRRHEINAASTDIEASLDQALGLLKPGRKALFWLLSDGLQTKGDATAILDELHRRNLPVLLFSPQETQPLPDSRIESLNVPQTAALGQSIPIQAAVSSEQDTQAILQLWVAGKPQDRKSVPMRAGQTETVRFEAATCPLGDCTIGLRLQALNDDSIPQNNGREALATVLGKRPLLYVQSPGKPSPLAESLAAGGWEIRRIGPGEFPRETRALENFGLVVLDDLPAAALPVAGWALLEKAVRQSGMGMIVLGGPHSFAEGGYRHSPLEELLPVTAEASNPMPAASILFLIDKSGSMDKPESGTSRIAKAKEAVLETLKTLGPEDQAGLAAFDAEPRLLLPIRHHDDPAKAFSEAFKLNALGGTRLAPALDFALEQLGKTQAGQRLLILVTDGVLNEKETAPLKTKIAGLNIELIVLAIGEGGPILSDLARLNHGKLLKVERMAELPRLMSVETAKKRNPAETGLVQPLLQTPIPFLKDEAQWPKLTGYMLAKPKPDATVYLASPRQDPLFATHYAGAGRVAALMGCLGGWAEGWPGWKEWGRFAGGLADWTANDSDVWNIELQTGPSEIRIKAETDQEIKNETGQAIVTGPEGESREIILPRTAPGQYQTQIPVRTTGTYHFTFLIGGLKANRAALYNPQEEFLPSANARKKLKHWLEAKLLRPWNESSAGSFARMPEKASIRPLVLGLALLIYLVLVAYERLGGVPFANRLLKKRC